MTIFYFFLTNYAFKLRTNPVLHCLISLVLLLIFNRLIFQEVLFSASQQNKTFHFCDLIGERSRASKHL